MAAFRRKKSHTHGWVWLYLSEPARPRAGEIPAQATAESRRQRLLTSHRALRRQGDVARLGELVGEAGERPIAGEDPVLLELEEPLAGISLRRQAVLEQGLRNGHLQRVHGHVRFTHSGVLQADGILADLL